MINRFICLLIFPILLSACATVNRGAKDHFRIDTVPQGAAVTISIIERKGATRTERRASTSQWHGSDEARYIGCKPTPCAIELPRRSEFVAKLEHPGYETTEIFIRSSNLKAGATSNAAVTLASASGSGFALAGMVASIKAIGTGLFSFGTQTVNTSGIASSGAAAGLGIGVGMIAIDVASGANKNLFPNPVVIELAPEGTPTRKDPLIDLYWQMSKAKTFSDEICAKRKKDRLESEPSCSEAKSDYQQKKELFLVLKREQLEEFKASMKDAREKQKTATQ